MLVKYYGQELNLISFHDKLVLWIQNPSQINIPKMTFVGGYPNEYCIFIDELTDEEKSSIKYSASELADYKMSKGEQVKATLADKILWALNGSYKPHCFDCVYIGSLGQCGLFQTIYMNGLGYIMITEGDRGHLYLHTRTPLIKINDYFMEVAKCFGAKNIVFDDFTKSSAIKHLDLSKMFVGLDNLSFELVLGDSYFSNSKVIVLYKNSNAFSMREAIEKYGLYYWDRNIWMMEL